MTANKQSIAVPRATETAMQNSAKEVFNSVGPAYEVAFENVGGQQAALKWLLATLPPKSNIIDVGCGTGRPVCSTLADAGHEVLGIDVSDAMLDFARKNVPNAQFEQHDTKAYTPDPGSYDAITVFFSMLASFTQNEIKEQIKKYLGWLKPGGLFVYGTVTMDVESQQIKWMGRDAVVSSQSTEDAIKAVEDAGFVIVEKIEQSFMPKAVEAGLCEADQVWEEPHLFLHARKPNEA